MSERTRRRGLGERSKRAIELYNAGWPAVAVAQQLGCSRAWVYHLLHREGVWRDRPRSQLATARQLLSTLHDTGFDEDFLSRSLGVSEQELRRVMDGARPEAPQRRGGGYAGQNTRPLPMQARRSSRVLKVNTPCAPSDRRRLGVAFDDTLTAREREVIEMVAHGLSNSEIARHLRLAEGTVKNHLHAIYKKTGAPHRTALALLAAGRNAR